MMKSNKCSTMLNVLFSTPVLTTKQRSPLPIAVICLYSLIHMIQRLSIARHQLRRILGYALMPTVINVENHTIRDLIRKGGRQYRSPPLTDDMGFSIDVIDEGAITVHQPHQKSLGYG